MHESASIHPITILSRFGGDSRLHVRKTKLYVQLSKTYQKNEIDRSSNLHLIGKLRPRRDARGRVAPAVCVTLAVRVTPAVRVTLAVRVTPPDGWGHGRE